VTRTQRTVHARTFAVLTPLFVVLIALALLRSQRTCELLGTPPRASHSERVAP
jgi:hypothetical protein